MRLAVLPFNAAEGTSAPLARQMANFLGETVRTATNADVRAVNYLVQIEHQDDRLAFANLSNELLEYEVIQNFFEQAGLEKVCDGLLKAEEGRFELTVRLFEKDNATPTYQETFSFSDGEIFTTLQTLVKRLAVEAGSELPEEYAGEALTVGTDNPEAFLAFLEGYDALHYIQQAQGRVAQEFSPQPALERLQRAVELDPDFLAPFETLVQLCRACAHYRIGTASMLEAALNQLIETGPSDYRALFALGELYQAANDPAKAADAYEKALALEAEEPAIYARLGLAQVAAGMPMNAERNFRKALELEDEDKPSLDYLAMVLQQTNRAHEIPALWKERIEVKPHQAHFHAKYALSLLQSGQKEAGMRGFEVGLEQAEDTAILKRYFAPVLAEEGDLDRAMDFYEDCLDQTPSEVPLLLEYAQVLQSAGREFEIPQVLRNVLAANPDPNIRAQTMAWLIELEQPKRVESVDNARQKMEQGAFEEVVKDLRPLRNWLGDYWKLWAILSSAHNRLGEYDEAEFATRRLLEIFPGCEPAYTELVEALTRQGREEEAYRFMQWAVSTMPRSLPMHVNLALAAKRAGHEEEARRIGKQIREVVGSNEELEPVLAEIEA